MTVIVPGYAQKSQQDGEVFIKTGRVEGLGCALVYVRDNADGSKTVETPRRTLDLLSSATATAG